MEEKYLEENPHLAEHPLTLNLSARLSWGSGSSAFRWESGQVLDTRNDLAGSFCSVPLEIIHDIFQQLDLASLRRLSATSQGMRRVVASLPKLRALMHCAPDAMRAVSAARASRLVICSDMHGQLIKPNCLDCGSPGNVLHILQCRRLCQPCLQTNTIYRARRPMQAVEQYALRLELLADLSAIQVPGYSKEAILHRRKFPWQITWQVNTTGWRLIDHQAVRDLCVRRYGSVERAIDRGLHRLERLIQRKGYFGGYEAWLNGGALHRAHQASLNGRVNSHLPPGVESACSVSTLFPWYVCNTGYFGRAIACKACVAAGLPLGHCFYCAPGEDEHMALRGKIVDGVHVKSV